MIPPSQYYSSVPLWVWMGVGLLLCCMHTHACACILMRMQAYACITCMHLHCTHGMQACVDACSQVHLHPMSHRVVGHHHGCSPSAVDPMSTAKVHPTFHRGGHHMGIGRAPGGAPQGNMGGNIITQYRALFNTLFNKYAFLYILNIRS